jgi:hypothetical protein
MPTIVPLLFTVTPAGNEPEIVIAFAPVELAEIITPLLIFTTNADEPFHPAVTAPARIQKLVWFADTV